MGGGATEEEVEDRTHLDGYRGSFAPFAYGHVRPPKRVEELGTTTSSSAYERSIVAEHMQTAGSGGGSGGSGQDKQVRASIAGVSACAVSSALTQSRDSAFTASAPAAQDSASGFSFIVPAQSQTSNRRWPGIPSSSQAATS